MENNDNDERRKRMRGVLCTVDPNTVLASSTTNEYVKSFFEEGSIGLFALHSILYNNSTSIDDNGSNNNNDNEKYGSNYNNDHENYGSNNNNDHDGNDDDDGNVGPKFPFLGYSDIGRIEVMSRMKSCAVDIQKSLDDKKMPALVPYADPLNSSSSDSKSATKKNVSMKKEVKWPYYVVSNVIWI
jgi:hypothetical protein